MKRSVWADRLLWLAAIAALVSVITYGLIQKSVRDFQSDVHAVRRMLRELAATIETEGVGPETSRLLSEVARPRNCPAILVAEVPYDSISSGPPPDQVVIASSDEGLVGMSVYESRARYAPKERQGFRIDTTFLNYPYLHETVVAPDGSRYAIAAPLFGYLNILAELMLLVSVLLCWAALVGFVALDARIRQRSRAAAWALLTVCTGPLGLAAWFLCRPAAVEGICPGCGAYVSHDGAFCVRCGFALKPRCPECQRVIAKEWEYCANCGVPLK